MLIYDYVSITQPNIIRLLKQLFGIQKPRLRKINGPVKVQLWCGDDEFDFYEAVMREAPKPGSAGILKNEKEVAFCDR
jgi:hypothetical protein